ncbi:MAG: hypothetical protein QXE85_00035 [Nitrososphaerota archaeon]
MLQPKPQKMLLLVDFPDSVLTLTPKELKLIAEHVDTILLGNVHAVPKEYLDYVGCEYVKIDADRPCQESLLIWRDKIMKIISEKKGYDEISFISPHFWKARAISGTHVKFRHSYYLRRLLNEIIVGAPL